MTNKFFKGVRTTEPSELTWLSGPNIKLPSSGREGPIATRFRASDGPIFFSNPRFRMLVSHAFFIHASRTDAGHFMLSLYVLYLGLTLQPPERKPNVRITEPSELPWLSGPNTFFYP